MTQQNFKRLLAFLLTLPVGILICRGRTIPMPHPAHNTEAMISERLATHALKQAGRHDVVPIERNIHRLAHQSNHMPNA